MKMQNHAQTQCHMTKMSSFENSIWGTAAILKRVLSLYRSGNHQILMKFGRLCRRKFCLQEHDGINIMQIQNGGQPPY